LDFNDTAEEAKFREEAAAWLKANVPTAEELTGVDAMGQAKLWQKKKADAGWACLRWPKEFGGRAATAIEQVIWGQEEAKVDSPNTGVFMIGQGMGGPTMMAWATEEQQKQYLPKLASGE
jgi:acyl-CoA dehydrogenase